MKILLIALTLWCGIVQISNAQYTLLTKGEANPYDSAVAVEIHQYRKESLKMAKADSIVKNFQVYVATTNKLIAALKKENSSLVSAIQLQKDFTQTVMDNQEEIKSLVVDLQGVEPVKPKFYEKPLVVGVAVLVVTLLLVAR